MKKVRQSEMLKFSLATERVLHEQTKAKLIQKTREVLVNHVEIAQLKLLLCDKQEKEQINLAAEEKKEYDTVKAQIEKRLRISLTDVSIDPTTLQVKED